MKSPRYTEVDGFRLPVEFDAKVFRDAMNYKPDAGRVIVATYPKCGTTWTLQIVILILRKGIPPADTAEYFSLVPFMEMNTLSDLKKLSKDACIKTHLPFDRINFSRDAKYIYVARHPADCVVSFYNHVRYFHTYFFSDGTFDDFFEVFITGACDFGDYFDNLLSWYEHRHEPNVFFITYEMLRADTKGMILRIAKFIGDEFYEDLRRDEEKILNNVIEYSSIDFMKTTVDKYFDEGVNKPPSKEEQEANPVLKNLAEYIAKAEEEGHFPIGNFIRKGAVGDGKITLSEDQMRRLEARIQEKCGQSDVMNLWKRA